MRSDRQGRLCKECASVCLCGKPKDARAAECLSCGMSRKAKAQWADPELRERIASGIRDAGQRRRYTDLSRLTFESFQSQKPDGRYFTLRSVNREAQTVRRARWVWEQAHGLIPDGCEIHHANHDCTDDRLENLVCLDRFSHHSYHGTTERGLAAIAEARRVRLGNPRTHCRKGHPFDTENTYISPNGTRACRTCKKAARPKPLRQL